MLRSGGLTVHAFGQAQIIGFVRDGVVNKLFLDLPFVQKKYARHLESIPDQMRTESMSFDDALLCGA